MALHYFFIAVLSGWFLLGLKNPKKVSGHKKTKLYLIVKLEEVSIVYLKVFHYMC